MNLLVLAACLPTLIAAVAAAHPGNVDADGCHVNRESGAYHCHPVRASVMDGDTFRAELGGKVVTVRLYGIDAPEGKQPGGDMCAVALRRLVEGKRLTITPYGQDRYGRMLAVANTAALGDTSVNQTLLESGHAWYFAKYCVQNFCPDWRQSERRARQAGRGIWAVPNPEPPWDWRAARKRLGGDMRQ